jgi:glycosyltransferase involved in cell wall biosynthesis
MKRLKVLFLINTENGINTYRRAVHFSSGLQSTGDFNVTLVYRSGNKLRDFFIFFKTILFYKYDFAHVFEPFFPTYPFLILLLRLKRVKILYDSGDIHYYVSVFSKASYILQLYDKLAEFLAYNICDMVIVRGISAIEVISKIYGIRQNKITWIPDGVDLLKFDSVDPEQSRLKLGLSSTFVIGYASSIRSLKFGNFVTSRGWELLEIGKMLINSGRSNFKMLIIGDGTGLNQLVKKSIDYGLKEHVIFPGFVSEAEYPLYIRSMNVGFYESINHPSYIVMMPTKLVEYLASSLAIVAGNMGEGKRAFRDNGFLFTPLEPDLSNLKKYLTEIFMACSKLYDDSHLTELMGINSRKVACDYYDWNKIIESYIYQIKLRFP